MSSNRYSKNSTSSSAAPSCLRASSLTPSPQTENSKNLKGGSSRGGRRWNSSIASSSHRLPSTLSSASASTSKSSTLSPKTPGTSPASSFANSLMMTTTATTTPRKEKSRRVCSAGPPADGTGPIRTLYLIRHGESQGQRASRQERKTSQRLLDCGLTCLGMEQAKFIPIILGPRRMSEITAVVTSPLTRAIHTTLLAFGGDGGAGDDKVNKNIPIIVAYDLCEVGSSIPENQPRKFKDIWRDLQVDSETIKQRFDLQSLKPRWGNDDDDDNERTNGRGFLSSWPCGHENLPKVVQYDRIKQVFVRLAATAKQKSILPDDCRALAIVCHFNVIRAILSDPWNAQRTHIQPINAQPLLCHLYSNGFVEFVRALGDDEDDDDDDNGENVGVLAPPLKSSTPPDDNEIDFHDNGTIRVGCST